jgi:hypothetical protein
MRYETRYVLWEHSRNIAGLLCLMLFGRCPLHVCFVKVICNEPSSRLINLHRSIHSRNIKYIVCVGEIWLCTSSCFNSGEGPYCIYVTSAGFQVELYWWQRFMATLIIFTVHRRRDTRPHAFASSLTSHWFRQGYPSARVSDLLQGSSDTTLTCQFGPSVNDPCCSPYGHNSDI